MTPTDETTAEGGRPGAPPGRPPGLDAGRPESGLFDVGSSVTVHDELPEEDRVTDYPPPTDSG